MAEITIPSGETIEIDSTYGYQFVNTTDDATNGELVPITLASVRSSIFNFSVDSLSLVSNLSIPVTFGVVAGEGGGGGATTGENWRN